MSPYPALNGLVPEKVSSHSVRGVQSSDIATQSSTKSMLESHVIKLQNKIAKKNYLIMF